MQVEIYYYILSFLLGMLTMDLIVLLWLRRNLRR